MSLYLRRVHKNTTSVVSFVSFFLFLPLFLLALQQTYQLITGAVGIPASITVDTKAVLEPVRTDFYHAFSQGGEESTDMLSPIVSDVTSLKPKLIRIDHIYDHYDVVGKQGSEITFSWTALDASVRTILSTGAKPVLVLSYMPSVIAQGGNIINIPTNWADWSYVVQKTIEHYSGQSGFNLADVYYEVWNEPDLATFGAFRLSGPKNYLTLYRYAAIGAQKAQRVNRFFLGGPATTGLYKNWILALVRSGVRLDFLSWHSYLANPQQFVLDQRNVISWLLPYPNMTLIPKLITEFGFTGNKQAGYSTMYGAAHAATVIKALMSGGPTYLFTFELKDGPNQGNTGWGLITHEDQGLRKKPRYFVYNFIDQMAGTRLTHQVDGTYVTALASTKNQTIRLLLTNFDPRGVHSENVPVAFSNLDVGQYKLHAKFLTGRETTQIASVSSGLYSTQVYMPAQAVALLELSRIDQ